MGKGSVAALTTKQALPVPGAPASTLAPASVSAPKPEEKKPEPPTNDEIKKDATAVYCQIIKGSSGTISTKLNENIETLLKGMAKEIDITDIEKSMNESILYQMKQSVLKDYKAQHAMFLFLITNPFYGDFSNFMTGKTGGNSNELVQEFISQIKEGDPTLADTKGGKPKKNATRKQQKGGVTSLPDRLLNIFPQDMPLGQANSDLYYIIEKNMRTQITKVLQSEGIKETIKEVISKKIGELSGKMSEILKGTEIGTETTAHFHKQILVYLLSISHIRRKFSTVIQNIINNHATEGIIKGELEKMFAGDTITRGGSSTSKTKKNRGKNTELLG